MLLIAYDRGIKLGFIEEFLSSPQFWDTTTLESVTECFSDAAAL